MGAVKKSQSIDLMGQRMNEPKPIYYECHITIEPVEDARLELFEQLSKKYKFKVATLLMRKSLKKSDLDSFTTAKSKKFDLLFNSMNNLLDELKKENFNIYRNKIEAVLIDTKIKHHNFVEMA